MALDDGLVEAHTSLAFVRHRFDWDWTGAEREFRRALELNPGYVTAHLWYAWFPADQGRDREALLEAQRAVALDPLSAIMHMVLGRVHYHARRFDLAVASERRALELDPHYVTARRFLAWALIAQGNAKAAIEVCEQTPVASGGEINPQILAALGAAYARAGDAKRFDEVRQQVLARRGIPGATAVLLNASGGDREALFAALDRAVAERSDIIPSLRVDPLFEAVRSDPRFAALLKRVGLS